LLQPGDVIVYGIRGRAWESNKYYWRLYDSFQLTIPYPAGTVITNR